MTATCCDAIVCSHDQRAPIAKIAAVTPCQRGFPCLALQRRNIGRVKVVGADRAVECLESQAAACNLAVLLAGGIYCACLVRLHIARVLGA